MGRQHRRSRRWVDARVQKEGLMKCVHCGHPAILHGLLGSQCEVCATCPGLDAPEAPTTKPGGDDETTA